MGWTFSPPPPASSLTAAAAAAAPRGPQEPHRLQHTLPSAAPAWLRREHTAAGAHDHASVTHTMEYCTTADSTGAAPQKAMPGWVAGAACTSVHTRCAQQICSRDHSTLSERLLDEIHSGFCCST